MCPQLVVKTKYIDTLIKLFTFTFTFYFMIIFAVRLFLLCCIYGTNALNVPFIKLSLVLNIWLWLVQFFFSICLLVLALVERNNFIQLSCNIVHMCCFCRFSTHKIISFSQNLSFLLYSQNICKLQPRYCYKTYSYKRKRV